MTIVADTERHTHYEPVTATTEFLVGFTVYEDDDVEGDLVVYHDGVKVFDWTLDAAYSGGEATTATIVATAPGWTGDVDIVGRRAPRRTTQFGLGRGVSAEAFNLAFNIQVANLREVFDRLEDYPEVSFDGLSIDFRDLTIKNLGGGTDDDDALTKEQIETLVATVNAGGLAYAAILVTYGDALTGFGGTVQHALDTVGERIVAAEEDIDDHEDRITALEAAGTIVGEVKEWAGAALPTGYLWCDGAAVSRATYSALFTAISTTYGAGDGTTTFNVPDCRGRVTAGQDDMGGSSANRLTNQTGGLNGDTLGATGGAETHVLTTAQLALHGHPFRISVATQGSASATTTGGLMMYTVSAANQVAFTGTPADTTGQQIGGSGGGTAHNNVQPTIIMNKIIYSGV